MVGINTSRAVKEHCPRDARASLTTQTFTYLDERSPQRIPSGHLRIVAHRCDHGIGWRAYSVACLTQLARNTMGLGGGPRHAEVLCERGVDALVVGDLDNIAIGIRQHADVPDRRWKL